MKKKILVTGFDPFDGESINPSSLILDFVSGDSDLVTFCDVLRVPVTFSEAHKVVMKKMKTGNYAGWIGFGQAGGRGKISLERVAINWKESFIPDNKGVIPKPGPLVRGVSVTKAHMTSLNLLKLKSALEKEKIPVEISFSAGAYVCNSLYYHVMREIRRTKKFGLFVHVPYLPEQVRLKPQAPSMTKVEMFQAAKLILKGVL